MGLLCSLVFVMYSSLKLIILMLMFGVEVTQLHCTVYLSELCIPVVSASGRQHLRSASMGPLFPRAQTMICQWSFPVV